MLLPKTSSAVFIVHLGKYTFCPVVVAYIRIAYYFISVNIKLPPGLKPFFVSFARVIFRIYIRLGDTVGTVCFTGFVGAGTWFVVVVHDVDVLGFAAVASFATPVVVNVVAHIDALSVVVI